MMLAGGSTIATDGFEDHCAEMWQEDTIDFISEVLFLIIFVRLQAVASYYYNLCSLAGNEMLLEPLIDVIGAALAV